ncbi:hypothetical protein GF382_02130, partial [Candidatus Falkowbacteria bacterium]|nr:hypothetical protein [Candidatus Falkowbacteria bacterium]
MKKILALAFSIFILLNLAVPVQAAQKDIYFFYGDGCPHCAKEEKFLDSIGDDYPEINIKEYEVWNSRENAKLLSEAADRLEINIPGVPVLIIGDKAVIGYHNDQTTGSEIRALLDEYASGECQDAVGSILDNGEEEKCEHGCEKDGECTHDCGCSADTDRTESLSQKITLPFLGEADVKDFSLPLLTVTIGILDGFNPCAMWVLLFLITLLLGMCDRRKMWILGLAFIITSALVYFLFLAAWLKLFLFIGFLSFIRWIIGAVAIGSGAYHLKEYFTNKEGACKVTGGEKKKKIFDKLKEVISQKSFLLSLLGIIVLAAIVNMVELVCSAGLPAVYTQVLALSNLANWQYYGYLLLYIFFFMLDDLLIFFIAMTTLKMTGISTKYTRYSNLIGGILILIIGIL